MTFNEALAEAGKTGPAEASEPFSAAWWKCRTAEELRDIIKRGFAGGDAFQGAVSESERRARAETRRLRDVAAAEAERKRKRNRVIGLASIAAIVVASGVYSIVG